MRTMRWGPVGPAGTGGASGPTPVPVGCNFVVQARAAGDQVGCQGVTDHLPSRPGRFIVINARDFGTAET